MRILFISTYFQPDIASTGVLMTQIAEELIRHGHRVTVVTSMPHYDRNRVRDEYRGKLVEIEKNRDLTIYRLRVYVPDEKTGFLGRLINYLSFNIFSAVVGLFAGRHDVIFVPSPPLMNGLVGDLLSRLKRIPFVYNVQDIWPDVVIRAGVMKNKRMINLSRKMEDYVYRRADAVSVISEGFKKNLAAKGVDEGKIRVIPNFFDTVFVHPQPRENDFRRSHGLDGKFVVLFGGNIGHSQGLETVLEAAEQLEQEPEIHFLIVGNGVAKPGLIAYAEELDLSNVTFLPFQPHQALPEMYAAADVSLVPLKKGFTNESVPCKVFTIMASGRPMIASVDRGSDTWQLVEEGRVGINAEVEDPQSLAESITQLFRDERLRTKMGENSREHILECYSKEVIGREYHQFLRDLMEGMRK